jgi:hypothetical protein
MAFSVNNFVNSQKERAQKTFSAQNIRRQAVPRQIQQIISPKPNALNKNLGDMAGVKLKNLFNNIGAQLGAQIRSLAIGSAQQLQAAIAGCINKAITDFLNDNPIIKNILFFDQYINNLLSQFRLKLESKIDSFLRKLAYDKLKIYQIALFRQKIAGAINNICPGASPATPSQTRKYKEIMGSLASNFKKDNPTTDDTDEILSSADVNNTTATTIDITAKEERTGISPKTQKELKENPVRREELTNEATIKAQNSIISEAFKQSQPTSDVTWEALYESQA